MIKFQFLQQVDGLHKLPANTAFRNIQMSESGPFVYRPVYT